MKRSVHEGCLLQSINFSITLYISFFKKTKRYVEKQIYEESVLTVDMKTHTI